jgi:hypothetical protein
MNDYKEWLNDDEIGNNTKKRSEKIHPYVITSITLKEQFLNFLNKYGKKETKAKPKFDKK